MGIGDGEYPTDQPPISDPQYVSLLYNMTLSLAFARALPCIRYSVSLGVRGRLRLSAPDALYHAPTLAPGSSLLVIQCEWLMRYLHKRIACVSFHFW